MISVRYMNSTERAASLRKSYVLGKDFMPPRQMSEEIDDCEKKLETKEAVHTKRKSKQRPTFPLMLHQILEDSEKAHTQNIVAWEDNGTSFHIHDPHTFNDNILPRYSKKKTKTKFRSFQRQLNIYGFKMTKKSGVYRHQLFRRGHMNSIARIRPRPTNGPKKRIDHQDDNDNVCESTNRSNVVSPSYDKRDPKGIDFHPDMHSSICKAVTTPLVSIMGNIALKRSISIEKGIGANNTENDCVRDSMDRTPVSGEINPASQGPEDLMSSLMDSRNTVASNRNPTLHAMAEGNFGVQYGSGASADSFGYGPSICTTTPRDLDFDLFDDLDEFQLCRCNGAGCYFEKYRYTTL